MSNVAVIGGGASGMVAAIAAARAGARVTVLERQDRVGKKLLATGNGRCNLTNLHCSPAAYPGADAPFVTTVIDQFPVDKTRDFFAELGALTVADEEGRVYPLTGQASTILDVLRMELLQLGVDVRTGIAVQAVRAKGDGFAVAWPGGEIFADRVVVAAGSLAAPHLGGSFGAVDLLVKLGHRAETPYPALVPLRTSTGPGARAKGVKVAGSLRLDIDGVAVRSEIGEVLFTEYGLSGIAIMQLSGHANRALRDGRAVHVVLDLLAGWSVEQVGSLLEARLAACPDRVLADAMIGLVHKRLIPEILREASIGEVTRAASTITSVEQERIVGVLKAWSFTVSGSLSWSDAQVMAGGISTAEFSATTLESRRIPGLYAAGEVLDVAGDCGGHNLQWAWSSGFVAGRSAARATSAT